MINKFSIFNGAKYFSSGIFQSHLVFIPAKKYIKYFSGTTWIQSWKSTGMSEENIETMTKSDSNFAPTFVDHHLLPDINFNEPCLIKNIISIPKKVINLYISCILCPPLSNLNTDFTLGNCLLRSVKLTKNTDLDKDKYSGYGTEFGSYSEFSSPDGTMEEMSLFLELTWAHLHVLLIRKKISEYSINFTQSGKSLPYNGSNSFLFVNATKVYQSKAKSSEIKYYALCLGNILKDFTINNMKKTGLKGVVTFFLLILILLILTIF